jgi:hypothetical protein
VAELEEDFEERLKDYETDWNTKQFYQLELLNDKLRHAEELRDLYKQQLESAKIAGEAYPPEHSKSGLPHNQSKEQELKAFRPPLGVSALNMRIDRVLAKAGSSQNHPRRRVR